MRWSQDEPEMRATYGDIVDDYRKSGEETLRRTASSEIFSGLDVDTQLLFGNNPAREILRLAKEREADAIVMGSREPARRPRRHGARDHRPAPPPRAGRGGQRVAQNRA